MSVAYLSPHLSSEKTGGTQVAKSNLKMLKMLFKDDVRAYAASRTAMPGVQILTTTRSTAGTALANFQGLCATLTTEGRREFLRDITALKPNLVWLDTSLFGGLIDDIRLRVPNVKIVSYFHNAEIDLLTQRLKLGSIQYLPAWLATYKNELSSVRKSDAIVSITSLDATRLGQLYGRYDAHNLPVCLQRSVKNAVPWANTEKVLFVGSEFAPNIDGLNFLNKQVAPLLKTKRILVAGKGLKRHLQGPQHSRIELLGFVDDLSALYWSCRASLAPIFSGGGMKVKIAESLMHARPVIATKFAAIGYEKAGKDSIMLANTAQDIATAIEEWMPTITESPERDFDENYSLEAGLKMLTEIINKV